MTGPVYRADPPEACLATDAEGMTILYHRRSGMTHLLTSPAPEILAALAEGGADAEALVARLSAAHELAGEDGFAEIVAARLEELEAAGLAWRA